MSPHVGEIRDTDRRRSVPEMALDAADGLLCAESPSRRRY
jgi:hypothetical protein